MSERILRLLWTNLLPLQIRNPKPRERWSTFPEETRPEISRARIRSCLPVLFYPSPDLGPLVQSPSSNLWNSGIVNLMLYRSPWEREEFIFSMWTHTYYTAPTPSQLSESHVTRVWILNKIWADVLLTYIFEEHGGTIGIRSSKIDIYSLLLLSLLLE